VERIDSWNGKEDGSCCTVNHTNVVKKDQIKQETRKVHVEDEHTMNNEHHPCHAALIVQAPRALKYKIYLEFETSTQNAKIAELALFPHFPS
jgi:hypothetical protein